MPAHDHSLYGEPDLVGIVEISPAALAQRLEAGDELQIIDVREPHEWEIANLAARGAILIPQNQVLDHLGELDTARDIVVMCRSGVRSATVIELLQKHGFQKLLNLQGGINAWATTVDPSLPTY